MHRGLSLLLLTALLTVESTTLTRVEVAARCLDGSPYSYYISQGNSATRFYLNHQGGGWCQDLNECAQRAQTGLGSSVNWTSTVNMGDGMSRSPDDNPLMYDWTFVYLPYCDGGSFTGSSSSTTPRLLYFEGLKIRQAVSASLKSLYGFGGATDMVIGGCSAGGLAAYLHLDWWGSQVPTAKARGLPDSGFFMDGNYNRDGKPNYDARMQNLYEMMQSEEGVGNTECTKKIGYKCLFAYHLIPYISKPFLALNSAYDATMGNGECGANSNIILDWANATSVNECGNYIRKIFQQLLQQKQQSAVFLDSCHHHCGEWNAITIDGLKSPKALAMWYNGGSNVLPKNGYMDQGFVYPCSTCC